MGSKIDNIKLKAKEILSSNDRIKDLLGEVKGKVEELNIDSEERNSFIYQVQLIIRMIQSHFRGEYSSFSKSTIVMLVFGLVYFVTPLDLIPDFIPALGLTDDISIIYMIFKSLSDDIERFRDWEVSVQVED